MATENGIDLKEYTISEIYKKMANDKMCFDSPQPVSELQTKMADTIFKGAI